MHRITLSIILLLAANFVDAASYQKTDGTIVDPIQFIYGGDHYYSGNDLKPGANLTDAELGNANLDFANLTQANLYYADLTYSSLEYANLSRANLTKADLGYADLGAANFTGAIDPPSTSSQLTLTPLEETIIGGAQLDEAIFAGADLSGAVFDHENDAYDATGWETATWTGASFHYLNPALFPTGMIHTDHGIVVRTPEPSTLILALIGLALVPRRRRR